MALIWWATGWPTFSAGDVLQAGATVLAAYWIQRALSHRAELNRIPIESVQRLVLRLEDSIQTSLDASIQGDQDKALAALTTLSLDLDWFRSMARAAGLNDSTQERLRRLYWTFKATLTDGAVNFHSAAAHARRMRLELISLHWELCKCLLEKHGALTSSVKSESVLS